MQTTRRVCPRPILSLTLQLYFYETQGIILGKLYQINTLPESFLLGGWGRGFGRGGRGCPPLAPFPKEIHLHIGISWTRRSINFISI
jgi:hypothetical protein